MLGLDWARNPGLEKSHLLGRVNDLVPLVLVKMKVGARGKKVIREPCHRTVSS